MAAGLLIMLPTVAPLYIFHDPKASPAEASPSDGGEDYRSQDLVCPWQATVPVAERRLGFLGPKHVPYFLALSDRGVS